MMLSLSIAAACLAVGTYILVTYELGRRAEALRLSPARKSSHPPEPRFNPDTVYMVNETYTSGHLQPGDRVRIVDFAGRWLVAVSLENGSRALLEASNVERSP